MTSEGTSILEEDYFTESSTEGITESAGIKVLSKDVEYPEPEEDYVKIDPHSYLTRRSYRRVIGHVAKQD